MTAVSPLFRFGVLLFVLLPLGVHAAEGTEMDSLIKKENYSIGYQMGIGMKYDQVQVDFQALHQGMQDALNGEEPALDRDEMKTLILELKKHSRDAQLKKLQTTLVENAEEAKDFLDKNGRRADVKTTESGLQYLVMKEGNGPHPGLEDSVKVNYRAMFPDGKEFDSSYSKGAPQVIQTDGVIKGWTEALQMMRVGSKWTLYVPPELAYGRGGLEPNIPPNKVLVFEIELLSIERKSDQM